jgi:hypothetical protein
MCGKLGGEEDRIQLVRAVRLTKPPNKVARPQELATHTRDPQTREPKP